MKVRNNNFHSFDIRDNFPSGDKIDQRRGQTRRQRRVQSVGQRGGSVQEGRQPVVHGQGQSEQRGNADEESGVAVEVGRKSREECRCHEGHAAARQAAGNAEDHAGDE